MPTCLRSCCSKGLFELFVSNFAFEDTRPTTCNAAAEKMHNDVKEIESRLDNKLSAQYEQLQNLSLTCKRKKPSSKSYYRRFGPTVRNHATLPINAKRILLEVYVVHFATEWDILKICVIKSRLCSENHPSTWREKKTKEKKLKPPFMRKNRHRRFQSLREVSRY